MLFIQVAFCHVGTFQLVPVNLDSFFKFNPLLTLCSVERVEHRHLPPMSFPTGLSIYGLDRSFPVRLKFLLMLLPQDATSEEMCTFI